MTTLEKSLEKKIEKIIPVSGTKVVAETADEDMNMPNRPTSVASERHP
jgi:hypothetical protein